MKAGSFQRSLKQTMLECSPIKLGIFHNIQADIIMIYFPLLCFLFAFAQSQYCQVPGCLQCDPNNFQICQTCSPYYQNDNGQCLKVLDSTSILNSLKDQDYLEPGPSSSSASSTQNSNPAGVLNSESNNEQIGKKQINYSISHTLHFSSIGNLVRGVACLYKTSQGICIICNQNYVMRPGNICVPSPQKCLHFDHLQTGRGAMCTSCADKYKLVNNTCVDIGCEVDSYYACAKCKPGFYMSIQGQCFDLMCNIIKNGVCQRCFNGYLINSEGRCIGDLNAVASLKMQDEVTDDNGNSVQTQTTSSSSSSSSSTSTQIVNSVDKIDNGYSQTSRNSTYSQIGNNSSTVNNSQNIPTPNIFYPLQTNTSTNQSSSSGAASNQSSFISNNSIPYTVPSTQNPIINQNISGNYPNTNVNQYPQNTTQSNSGYNTNTGTNTNTNIIAYNNTVAVNQNNSSLNTGLPSNTSNIINNTISPTSTTSVAPQTNIPTANVPIENSGVASNISSNVTTNNFQINRNDNSQNTLWNTSITTSNQSSTNSQNITTAVIFNPSISNQTTTIFNTASYTTNPSNNTTPVTIPTSTTTLPTSTTSTPQGNTNFQTNTSPNDNTNSAINTNSNINTNLTINPVPIQNGNSTVAETQNTNNNLDRKNTTDGNSQTVINNFPNTQNSQLIVQIEKPPNCLAMSKDAPIRCVRCQSNYYLTNENNVSDSNNYCRKISRFCSSYDALGTCQVCENSTVLKAGTCIDPNCEKYAAQQNTDDRTCHTCKTGYYLNNEMGGVCSIIFKDDNCLNIHINVCLECRIGYYINPEDSHCILLPDNCYDKDCIYCQEGYVSIQNSCKKITNCSRISSNTCEICSSGFALTKFGTCFPKISYCIEYTLDGCSKCSINSLLTKNKTCQINPKYVDPYCRIKSRNQCSICVNGYYINQQTNLCEPVSPLCADFNSSNGHCTSCYPGYFLNTYSGECLEKKPILNCAQQEGNICLRCSNRYYLYSATQCREVNKLCNEYDENFGFCETCYQGYIIYNGQCIIQSEYDKLKQAGAQQEVKVVNRIVEPVRQEDIVYVEKIQSIYCKKIDPNDSTACMECYNAFYLDANSKKCLRANPVCRTYDNMTGQCKSCYNGYELITNNGYTTCLPLDLQRYSSPTQVPSLKVLENLVCLKRDETLQKCLECPERYYNNNGICIEAIPECKEFDKSTGQCFQCYSPYKPSPTQPQSCELAMNDILVPYCQDYTNPDLGPLSCLKCISGYYLKGSECTAISILCKRFDESANECAQCISGYVLIKEKEEEASQCVQPAIFDENCAVYGVNGYCQICKNGLQVINGICAQ